jgi:hypothetical protein
LLIAGIQAEALDHRLQRGDDVRFAMEGVLELLDLMGGHSQEEVLRQNGSGALQGGAEEEGRQVLLLYLRCAPDRVVGLVRQLWAPLFWCGLDVLSTSAAPQPQVVLRLVVHTART